MGADRQLAIAERCNGVLLDLKTVTVYAPIDNIRGKTDQELCELRAMGIEALDIGFETGPGRAS